MRKKIFALGLALSLAMGSFAATRPLALLGAKNLVITTKAGVTYYYIVSSNDTPMLHREGAQLVVGRDTFRLADIKAMRFKSMPRFVLDQDSTAFAGNYAVDHGLLALRRNMQAGQWNSLIVPVDLTAEQVTDAFGDDTRLATIRGLRDGNSTLLDFETIDLKTNPGAVVMKAGQHYVVNPSRQPDYAEGQRAASSWGNGRPYGPLYLIPNVSMAAGQKKPRSKTSFEGTNYESYVQATGSYYQHNVGAGNFLLNADGRMEQVQETTPQPGFTSFFADHRADTSTPLRFYIDGIDEDITATTGIHALMATPSDQAEAIFDLHGRRLNSVPQKGIYVKNGKKYIVK